jgi:hypothetical protein
MSECLVARPVHLEWAPVSGAEEYEIEVTRNHESVAARKMKADLSHWDLNLPVGIYSFRMRAVDWSKQAGEWSTPQPLNVLPLAPKVLGPKAGETFAPEISKTGIWIKWSRSVGAEVYKLELEHRGKIVESKEIREAQFYLKTPLAGAYAVRVAGGMVVKGSSVFGESFDALEFSVSEEEEEENEKEEPPEPPDPEGPHTYLSFGASTGSTSWTNSPLDSAISPRTFLNGNTVLDLNFAIRLSRSWIIGSKLQGIFTAYQAGDIPTVQQGPALFESSLHLGFRPWFWRRMEIRAVGDFGLFPRFGNGGDGGGSLGLIWLPRAGVGLALPLLSFRRFEGGVEAKGLLLSSKDIQGEAFAGGTFLSGTFYIERNLVDGLHLRAALAVNWASVTSSSQTTQRTDLLFGLNVLYRLGP